MAQRVILILSLVLVAIGGGSSGADSADVPDATMPSKHKQLLQKYCLNCHDEKSQEGNVDLEQLSFDLDSIETAERWQKVLGVINAGEMPPEDEPQLVASEKTEFLGDLSDRLVVARKRLGDQGGAITMRRLNRREYANTIRDLLGVEVDVRDLPNDANAGGFDTAGSSLFLSSDQFERYLQIGRVALDTALQETRRPKKGKATSEADQSNVVLRREPEVFANRQVSSRLKKLTKDMDRAKAYRASDRPPTDFGFIDEARVEFEEGAYRRQAPPYKHYLTMPETETGVVLVTSFAGAMLDVTQVPRNLAAGDYVLRVRAGALPGSPTDKRYLEYGRKLEGTQAGEMGVEGCRYVGGTIDQPQIIEIPIKLSSSENRSIVLRARQQNNRTAARRVYQAALAKGKPMPDPVVWVDWVELVGPVIDSNVPATRDRILKPGLNPSLKLGLKPGRKQGQSGDRPDHDQTRTIITDFATRAFRFKQPSPAYIERLMELYHARLDAGDPFEEAIKEPLSVVLASPSFLYLREPNDAAERRLLTDAELAIRLSYFLWSSPPDATLRSLATSGQLSDPEVLAKQVERMIQSPRISEFVSGFTHQWLTMERLDFFQFDAQQFPEFDDSVKAASRLEVYRTIETLLREGLPIGSLLHCDFVVINDLLADYYGIDGVQGHEFQTVPVPEGTPRGGLVGMAAVLAMGSDGVRSSPVERGAWVLRKLLNDPPPPAPANVPQLSRLEGEALSARELQKAHQEEPQCAQCHRNIDPIGFGLENFDAAGQWRNKETVRVASKKNRRKTTKKSFPIDPSGTLPDGTSFADFDELRERLLENEQAFANGFTQALIEYGLGRPYSFSDDPLTAQIVESARAEGYSLKTFLHAFVQSQAFQSK